MSGNFWAWTTFLLGLCCGGYTWAYTSRWHLKYLIDKMMRVSFAVLVALSVFTNLAYIVWICGAPLAMGVVTSGHMAENYWLGPVTLLFAVATGFSLKKSARSNE